MKALAGSQKAWWTLRTWVTSKKNATVHIPVSVSPVPSISWFWPSTILTGSPTRLPVTESNGYFITLEAKSQHMAQDGFKIQSSCLSSRMQGLQMWATMPAWSMCKVLLHWATWISLSFYGSTHPPPVYLQFPRRPHTLLEAASSTHPSTVSGFCFL